MKKNLYFLPVLLLILLMQSACKSDDHTPTEGELVVDATTITFPAIGGVRTIKVTAKDMTDWSVYSDISWLTVSEPDLANGTVTITAAPTEDIFDLNGTVVVYGGNKASAKVTVRQIGQGIVYERPTLARMNVKGDVEEMSYHVNPVYIFELNKSELRNLKFNTKGMLTYYECSKPVNDNLIAEYKNTLTYDASGRLEKLISKSNLNVAGSDGTPAEYELTFEYSDHGKYIETDQLTIDLNSRLAYAEYRAWMPKMIKNLSGVKVRNTLMGINTNYRYDFVLTEEGRTLVGKFVNATGDPIEVESAWLRFEGDYTKSVIYYGGFAGVKVLVRDTYNLDKDSGSITSIKRTLPTFGEVEIGEFLYMKNVPNTLYRRLDSDGYDLTADINGKYDIVSMINNNPEFRFLAELAYEYDSYGNWTKAETTKLESFYTKEFKKTRTIKYR